MRVDGRFRGRTLGPLAFVAAALAVLGCAETRPPTAAPLVRTPPPVHAVHLAGGPIVRTPAPAAPYDDPVTVRVTYYVADRMPETRGGVSVGEKSRLVVLGAGAESPVRPSAELTRDAILVERAGDLANSLAASPPQFVLPVGELVGVLPRGVTFSTRLDDVAGGAGAGEASVAPARRFIAVDVARPAAGAATTKPATRRAGGRPLQIALTVADVTGGPGGVRQETALVNATASSTGEPVAVAVPFAVTGSDARAVIAVIDFAAPGTRGPSASLMARLDSDLRRTAGGAATQPSGSVILTDTGASFVSAVLPGLLDDGRRRTSLISLADAVDAPVTRDLALAADDQTLTTLADRIIAKMTEPESTFDKEGVAWRVESASLGLLTEQQSAHTLAKPLEAVLTVHTGEAGRHEGSLDEILQAAHTRAGLVTAVVNENIILLSDSSPSARVRAYDWLSRRGLAPEGYDPLAPPRQRQAAIDRWMERRAAASQPATRAATTVTPP